MGDRKTRSVSVAYSATLRCVQCTVTLLFVSPCKSRFSTVVSHSSTLGFTMYSVFSVLRIARNTFHCGIDNALGFSRTFCKFEVNTMHTDFSLCESLEKYIFHSCPRQLKAYVL